VFALADDDAEAGEVVVPEHGVLVLDRECVEGAPGDCLVFQLGREVPPRDCRPAAVSPSRRAGRKCKQFASYRAVIRIALERRMQSVS